MEFEEILKVDGADNMGGVSRLAYFALLSDIATLPSYPASPSNLAEHVTISDAIVMKSGKQFFAIEIEPKTGEVKNELIEGSGNGQNSSFEFMIPGNTPTALGFAKVAPTSNMVAIVVDNDGQRRLFGIKNPARITTNSGTTDKEDGNNKGQTFTLTSYQNGPAPVYTGLIDNDSGSGSGI
jgi:hypothetical protein